ncbi:hypothetical protein BJ138DRAFT_1118535 [Hygrophoropsis aurantiaca]|uniref:Uncharacterized protein n=1 Tax=Hygrophoropsis aurantiaca TaxID=72124 RepID=A0ACB7ZWV1_9AGAM|nr:hypothetical protein BJ138DRAFT_1118535 [Hygrophoropsis aurantiaca]
MATKTTRRKQAKRVRIRMQMKFNNNSCPICPSFKNLTVATIIQDFRAANFIPALYNFLRLSHPQLTPPQAPSEWDIFNGYRRVSIQYPALPAVHSPKPFDRIRATPAVPASNRLPGCAANFDTVLVQMAEAEVNPHTDGTWLQGKRVAQVHFIFTLPTHLQQSQTPTRLAYVEWFTPRSVRAIRRTQCTLFHGHISIAPLALK